MRKLLILFLLCVSLFSAQAQELKWYSDIHEAIEISAKENKPMLLFFTGSDWCGWCIKLQNEVLKTSEFKDWALNNVVLVELDYPRRTAQTPELKNQNAQLQSAFQVQGFPTIFFASAEKIDTKINFKGIGKTGYVAGGPQPFLKVVADILKK